MKDKKGRITDSTDGTELIDITSASELMTTKEAAAYLKLSVKTIYNYKCAGQLKAYSLGGKSGGALRFKKADVHFLLFGKRSA